jgi:hypothetical protein
MVQDAVCSQSTAKSGNQTERAGGQRLHAREKGHMKGQ